MNLNAFMEQGIFQLAKTAGRYYIHNAKGIAFLARAIPELKQSANRRKQHEAAGTHVPPFLIASITSRCNLHCAGCYSRANGSCSDNAMQELTTTEWENVFQEASDLGVSFILLAGGEPLLRKDVIQAATNFPNIIFPVFTNGTMMDNDYLHIFEAHRNIIPVFSIEGDGRQTDSRRGTGTFDTVRRAMARFAAQKILFGASITVTKPNMDTVAAQTFVNSLRADGCGLLFFVEYVPVEEGTEALMLDTKDVRRLQKRVDELREQTRDMILVSFPGDEEAIGGCLASGRGFFHINANGGAEPCPFSPYAHLNLKTASIIDVLRSSYFEQLREVAANAGHDGGCTLFSQQEAVLALQG